MLNKAVLLAAGLVLVNPVFSQDKVENFSKIYGIEQSDALKEKVSTMGRYEGFRESANTVTGNVDVQTYTYTRPQRFQVHLYMDRKKESEGKGVPHADLFMMSIDMSLPTYQSLFESEEEVRLEWEGTIVYDYQAFAKTIKDRRVVTIRQSSKLDDETPVVTRKGKAVLVLKDSKIESFHMQKWARRSLINPIGWIKKYAKVLDDTVSNMEQTSRGMALRDEGEVGRALTADQVRRALADQKPSSYWEIAKENK